MRLGKKEYSGRCHCGQLKFSFRAEEITSGMRCNCSICVRKGALMSRMYIPPDDFKPIAEDDSLADYRWNDRVVNHLFCKVCGVYPYHGDEKIGYRVNLGCVEQLDPLELDCVVFDGKSMPVSDCPGPHPE